MPKPSLDPSHDPIRDARRWFAEELRFVARVNSAEVVEAFATVPRERFLGPGPLRILSLWNMRDYWTPPVASPTAAYHDVIIAYDEKRYLNNGQPSLWAFVFDKLNVVPGDRVLHLGCGMGYYTAVLAELAGPKGAVSAIEIDEPLAERAREALAPWRSGHGRQRRRRQRFVLEVRRCGRQRRSDPPDAGLARLPQAGGTARLSADDSE